MTNEENIKTMMEEEHKIMDGYIDSAKTLTQLSVGALVLSAAFLEKIMGIEGKIAVVPQLIVLAWFFWLLAAIAGGFYHYRAIKWLEKLAVKHKIIVKGNHARDFLNINPYIVYAILLVCFSAGTVCFGAFAIMKIA